MKRREDSRTRTEGCRGRGRRALSVLLVKTAALRREGTRAQLGKADGTDSRQTYGSSTIFVTSTTKSCASLINISRVADHLPVCIVAERDARPVAEQHDGVLIAARDLQHGAVLQRPHERPHALALRERGRELVVLVVAAHEEAAALRDGGRVERAGANGCSAFAALRACKRTHQRRLERAHVSL
eukprot:315407-Pleurochrysis_carterae.AAC.3